MLGRSISVNAADHVPFDAFLSTLVLTVRWPSVPGYAVGGDGTP
ncbi:hypothetical protein [Streptomyces sp. NPDC005805]